MAFETYSPREARLTYLKEMYKAADTELRLELASFDALMGITRETFDMSPSGETKFSPEKIDDRGNQINILFEKMSNSIQQVIDLLSQTQHDRESLADSTTQELPAQLLSPIKSIQRFLEGHVKATDLSEFILPEYYGPIYEKSNKLNKAYFELKDIIGAIVKAQPKS